VRLAVADVAAPAHACACAVAACVTCRYSVELPWMSVQTGNQQHVMLVRNAYMQRMQDCQHVKMKEITD
jgi:cell division inhibitor SulA